MDTGGTLLNEVHLFDSKSETFTPLTGLNAATSWMSCAKVHQDSEPLVLCAGGYTANDVEAVETYQFNFATVQLERRPAWDLPAGVRGNLIEAKNRMFIAINSGGHEFVKNPADGVTHWVPVAELSNKGRFVAVQVDYFEAEP